MGPLFSNCSGWLAHILERDSDQFAFRCDLFFPIIKAAFFKIPEAAAAGNDHHIINKERERPIYLFMVAPLAITALFSIIFCFFPGTFYILDLAELAVNNLLP